MDDTPRRRTVLGAVGSGFALALAGCLGGNDEDLLSDAVDETASDEVTVLVGAGQGLAYEPDAVRVTTDTTITWEWTGRGGGHDVVDDDGAFESEQYFNEGETFSHTFDETGVYRYVCTPHQTQGMIGAVEVIDAGEVEQVE